MKITPENDPLEKYGYGKTMKVHDVKDLLDVSDGTARKFLKSNDLYLKISGTVRVPRLGLSRVLFGRGETPEEADDSVIDLPEVEAS